MTRAAKAILMATLVAVGATTAAVASQLEPPAMRKSQVQATMDQAKREARGDTPGGPGNGQSCEALRKRLEKLPPQARTGNAICFVKDDPYNLPPGALDGLEPLKDQPWDQPTTPPVYDETESYDIGTLNRAHRSVQPGQIGKPPACYTTAVNSVPYEPYYWDRVQACEWYVFHVDVVRKADGRVIGQAYFRSQQWQLLNNRSLEWDYFVQITMYSNWGDPTANGMGVYVGLVCPDPCRVIDAGNEEPVLAQRNQIYSGKWRLSQPTAVDTVTETWQPAVYVVWAPWPDTEQGWGYGDMFMPVRCDAMSYIVGAGCVYPYMHGKFWLAYNDPDAGHSAQFIAGSQRVLVGHPGEIGGSFLHRIDRGSPEYTANVNAKNAACAAMQQPVGPPDYDCDEYPFASTLEGARTGNFRVQYLWASHNRSAGGKLSGFYSADRILYGDPFWVVIY